MDVFGITYIIETAQQFWSELEEMVKLPQDPTLNMLDSALNRFVSFCASYHEQYLQTQLQVEHACEILLQSELFTWHSARMCDILLAAAIKNTDPHLQLIIEHVLLAHGRRKPAFLRAQARWQPLMPLLMDAAYIEIDVEEISDLSGRGAPIEAKLRMLAIQLLYEVSRSQKMTVTELRIFDDHFIIHLFNLVEETRALDDEDTFNYAVIKLLVALNEQFMVAAMPAGEQPGSALATSPDGPSPTESRNRVLKLLIRRMNSCQTFSENLIFMLNRASNRSVEDRCMQVLVLKLLYLLFTTPGTSEFFYTNDLCVLVDVFLRELVDLDESSESLRHTFLRVLHPLLTRTQLRVYPYKRLQIVRTLESLVSNGDIRDVDPTTKRLVERCLSGDWCVPVKASIAASGPGPTTLSGGVSSPHAPIGPAMPKFEQHGQGMSRQDITRLGRRPSHRRTGSMSRRLKPSRSVENLSSTASVGTPLIGSILEAAASTTSLAEPTGAANATAGPSAPPKQRQKHRPPPAPPQLAAVMRSGTNDSTASLNLPGAGLASDISGASISTSPVNSKPPMLSVRKQRSDSTDILETSGGLESHARSTGLGDGDDPSAGSITRMVDSLRTRHASNPSPPPISFLGGERTLPPSPLIPSASTPVIATQDGSKPARRKAPPAPPVKQRRKPPPAPARVVGVASMSEMTGHHGAMGHPPQSRTTPVGGT